MPGTCSLSSDDVVDDEADDPEPASDATSDEAESAREKSLPCKMSDTPISLPNGLSPSSRVSSDSGKHVFKTLSRVPTPSHTHTVLWQGEHQSGEGDQRSAMPHPVHMSDHDPHLLLSRPASLTPVTMSQERWGHVQSYKVDDRSAQVQVPVCAFPCVLVSCLHCAQVIDVERIADSRDTRNRKC